MVGNVYQRDAVAALIRMCFATHGQSTKQMALDSKALIRVCFYSARAFNQIDGT
jgi:hypothetical protein